MKNARSGKLLIYFNISGTAVSLISLHRQLSVADKMMQSSMDYSSLTSLHNKFLVSRP